MDVYQVSSEKSSKVVIVISLICIIENITLDFIIKWAVCNESWNEYANKF